eukprot:2602104-Rhodomonas_salina.1
MDAMLTIAWARQQDRQANWEFLPAPPSGDGLRLRLKRGCAGLGWEWQTRDVCAQLPQPMNKSVSPEHPPVHSTDLT